MHDCQRQSDSATTSLLLGWIVAGSCWSRHNLDGLGRRKSAVRQRLSVSKYVHHLSLLPMRLLNGLIFAALHEFSSEIISSAVVVVVKRPYLLVAELIHVDRRAGTMPLARLFQMHRVYGACL